MKISNNFLPLSMPSLTTECQYIKKNRKANMMQGLYGGVKSGSGGLLVRGYTVFHTYLFQVFGNGVEGSVSRFMNQAVLGKRSFSPSAHLSVKT